MDLGLKGKVALVGGGSRGLGFAVARVLAGEGAKVSLIGNVVGCENEAKPLFPCSAVREFFKIKVGETPAQGQDALMSHARSKAFYISLLFYYYANASTLCKAKQFIGPRPPFPLPNPDFMDFALRIEQALLDGMKTRDHEWVFCAVMLDNMPPNFSPQSTVETAEKFLHSFSTHFFFQSRSTLRSLRSLR